MVKKNLFQKVTKPWQPMMLLLRVWTKIGLPTAWVGNIVSNSSSDNLFTFVQTNFVRQTKTKVVKLSREDRTVDSTWQMGKTPNLIALVQRHLERGF